MQAQTNDGEVQDKGGSDGTLTLTQEQLSKRVIVRREQLMEKLGNKTVDQLNDEMDKLLKRQEDEVNEALPQNGWSKAPFLVAFNSLFLVGLVKSGRRIQKFNTYLSSKVPHSFGSAIFLSLLQSTVGFTFFI